MLVDSPIAERLKTWGERLKTYEIRKYKKNLKPSQNHSLVPRFPRKTKTLSILAKTA